MFPFAWYVRRDDVTFVTSSLEGDSLRKAGVERSVRQRVQHRRRCVDGNRYNRSELQIRQMCW